MKRIRLLLTSLVITFSMGMVAVPALGYAQTAKTTACTALGSSTCSDTAGSVSVSSLVKTVINILSWVVGVVSVIMIIVGGFRYITSAGDANKVSSAKNTIIYAIVGLVIVALAQFIVGFVLLRTVHH